MKPRDAATSNPGRISHLNSADDRNWKLRQAWMEFLGRYRWNCMVTLTFDRSRYLLKFSRQPEQADKAFRHLICYINRETCGPRWMSRSPTKGVVWARVQEAHGDGALHLHAVIHAPSGAMGVDLIRQIVNWWKSRYGFARAEPPSSEQAVLRYLIKNVGRLDLAEMDFSHNFGRAP